MLSKLIDRVTEDENGEVGSVLCLVASMTLTLLTIMGLYEIGHAKLLLWYPAVSLFLFLASTRSDVRANQRGRLMFGILLWGPTLIGIIVFNIFKALFSIPGMLINLHIALSNAKLPIFRIPSFRKNIEMGEVPGQGPFRDSACCNSCNRPL